MDANPHLADAIAAIGGQTAAARLLKVSQSLVRQWLIGDRPLSPKHCPAIEKASGIRCEQLRPEVLWTRDRAGEVTGYHVPLRLPRRKAA